MFPTQAVVLLSGGSVPEKPELAHTGYGQFTITNYRATNQTYTISVSAGTFTRTNAVIRMSGTGSVNALLTVRATNSRGSSAPKYAQRKAYTFTRTLVGFTPTFPCNCKDNKVAECNDAPGTPSACCANCYPSEDGQDRCICWRWGQPTTLCYSTCGGEPIYQDIKDPTPTNPDFTDQYGEWVRIYG